MVLATSRARGDLHAISRKRIPYLTWFGMLFAVTLPVFSSTIVTANTSAGPNSCSQSGGTSASCSSSNPGGAGQTATANAMSTDTWGLPGGRLESTTNAFGPSTSASASVSFAGNLVVSGASGPGNLGVQFTGFQDATSSSPATASVSMLTVTIGAISNMLVFPGTPSTFGTSAAVSFNAPIPFSVSFSDMAAGTMFHDGTYASGNADAVLLFPTFIATDSNGNPLGGVTFTPEPGTFALLGCGLLIALGVRYRNHVSVRSNGKP